MVSRQIERRGIGDPAILDAFRAVPREEFVPAEYAAHAYEDGPLPIGAGQTISQPYIVALMIEAAGVKPGDRVLEVGAGSGYAAAVMSRIAADVIAIERQPELAAEARARLERLGFGNVRLIEGDGTLGWPEGAPFDAILTAAAAQRVPAALVEPLASDGTLVIPVGPVGGIQELVRVSRGHDGATLEGRGCAVRFVPLISGG